VLTMGSPSASSAVSPHQLDYLLTIPPIEPHWEMSFTIHPNRLFGWIEHLDLTFACGSVAT
jgi:hypothetical protein